MGANTHALQRNNQALEAGGNYVTEGLLSNGSICVYVCTVAI